MIMRTCVFVIAIWYSIPIQRGCVWRPGLEAATIISAYTCVPIYIIRAFAPKCKARTIKWSMTIDGG